jgi:DnaA regulatory inactivator Hda
MSSERAELQQLALDLPHAEGTTLSDFLPAASNRQAYDALMAWPAWPATALVLEGPEGAGKTHLLRIWVARAHAVQYAPAELWEPAQPLRRLGSATAATVDNVDEVEDEVQLFHLYNLLAERRGSLLLTASRPMSSWPFRLPDLRSRLATGWTVRIHPPCDALLAGLLVKQFADRQLRVEPEVVDYLVNRMERSFAAVRRIVEGLDRASLRSRRPIRLPLARLVLQAMAEGDDAAALTPAGTGGQTVGTAEEWRLDQWISA